MAVAFYIPDQATLVRKAQQQEQQLLRLRESQWRRFLATVMLETVRQMMTSSQTAVAARTLCPARTTRKWRKPSQ